jgi:hypothetical protein
MFELFAGLIILTFIVSIFFVFDNEILRGHFAKKIRKHFGVEEEK